MSMKPLRLPLGLDLALQRINNATKYKKKLLKLQDFQSEGKFW